MKNLMNAGLKALETKVRSIKGWRHLLALVLVAPFAALSTIGPTPLALAAHAGVKGHTFDITFTKWRTTFANMAGAGGVAVAELLDASDLNRHYVQIIREYVNLRSASKGRISATGTYQTNDTLTVVLTHYIGRYQPEPGQHKMGQCVILRRANSYFMLRQTVLVTLCALGNGTRIVQYRDLYLGP